jgi:prepilin-type N-terminal cleavage/methylation domain-containing protein
MYMNTETENQNGFTLIEILLSIILLSIILTSFFGFLTQSAMFAQKNGQKLNTMQTAELFNNLFETNVSRQDLINKNIIKGDQTTTITIDKSTIDGLVGKTIESPFSITARVKNDVPKGLIQVTTIVQDPKDLYNKSETFTYIRK